MNLFKIFRKPPSARDIAQAELFKIPSSEWLEIGWQMNRWNWPDQLMHIKPEWWINCEKDEDWGKHDMNRKYAYMRLIGISDIITDTFGYKQELYYHNVIKGCGHNGFMTEEEFEDFWKGNHEGDEEARARYMDRLMKEI
jgi:hypothetical protein